MTTSLKTLDIAALAPLLVLLGGGLLQLLLETFLENHAKKIASTLAFLTLLVALFYEVVNPGSTNALLTPWLRFDNLSHILSIFFLSIGLAAVLLAAAFFQRFDATHGEYYFFLISALFGLILVGMSADFLTLFLGIETLSISLYVLCGYMKKWQLSHEAAIKYFLIGALAAAFLLYGIALIYGAVGTTRFESLLIGYQTLKTHSDITLFLAGAALVTVGLAFKAAIVPFHIWAPDVYDGSPSPVTGFMAVGTKVGAFAALMIVFLVALPNFHPLWNQGIAFLACITLIYANFVALKQVQLRRFFAYSGISHAGFLMIPLAAGTPDAIPSMLFYLIVYAFATMGAFACLAFIDKDRNGVLLDDLHGLFAKSPFLACIFSLCLLTLAGFPPTAGFLAKFYLFKVAFQAGYFVLVIVGLLMTILSAYYYLRIIAVMFAKESPGIEQPKYILPAMVLGSIAFIGILWLSFYPEPLLNLLVIFR